MAEEWTPDEQIAQEVDRLVDGFGVVDYLREHGFAVVRLDGLEARIAEAIRLAHHPSPSRFVPDTHMGQLPGCARCDSAAEAVMAAIGVATTKASSFRDHFFDAVPLGETQEADRD